MHQPSISLLGVLIDEPVTTLTDLLVTVVCIYALMKLVGEKFQKKIYGFFRLYFLTLGIATFLSGVVGHGFLYFFGLSWKLPGWLFGMFAVSFFVRASIESAQNIVSESVLKILRVANIVELAIMACIVIISHNFYYVTLHSIFGMVLVVASLNIYMYLLTRNKGSLLILLAICITAMSAIIFQNKWSFSPWYNHFDISHTLMAISVFYYYRASIFIESQSNFKVSVVRD